MFVIVTLRIVSSISALFCQHIIEKYLNSYYYYYYYLFQSGLPGFHRVGNIDQALIHYSTKRF
jgi:hypothetical protein